MKGLVSLVAYSPKGENFLSQIVDMNPNSGAAIRTVSRAHHTPPLGKDIQAMLGLLRFFGFFPGYFRSFSCGESNKIGNRVKIVFLKIYALSYIGVTIGLIYLNYLILREMIEYIGVLHVRTLTSILTGLKPLQGFFNLAVFFLNFRQHKNFLKVLR